MAMLAVLAAMPALCTVDATAAPYQDGAPPSITTTTVDTGTALRPEPAGRAVAVAQSVPATSANPRAPALRGLPGDKMPLVHDLVDMAASTGNYVIINKAPAWVSLTPAESIGSGVWLISPEQLRSAHINLSAAANGRHEMSIAVVGPGGSPIAEAKMLVDVTAGAVAAAPAAAPALVAVATAVATPAPTAPAAAVPAAPSSKATRPAQVAAAPAAPTPAAPVATAPVAPTPVAPTPVTKPAAPAAPAATVAQAPEPSKDGTKAWTEFLTGKPGAKPAVPAAKPAQAKPPGGGKSEAELVGFAKHLVRECTTCHSLYGQDVGIPLMVGLAKDRFLDTMELYRIGKRDNPAMQSVAQALNEEETLALALYLGRIKPPPQTAAARAQSAGVASPGSAAAVGAALDIKVADKPIPAGSKELERVERWLKRGKQMIDAGEISQARLLLTRATELGDPRAALMLATSYDPNVLPWRPGMGLEAEPARAKALYQLAIRLGAGAEAEKRLNDLP